MSSPTTNTVKLDKVRSIRFDFSAFDRMKREHGLNAMRPSTFQEMPPDAAATLLWGGQLHTKDALTREEILKHIPTDTDAFFDMMLVVSRQLNIALGGKTDGPK